ncbi:XRE family transcriptional regulator [Streptomyces sp. NPDC001508]|uniref:RICIN domain-containing protein n=1 Tax=Streptomyces sp. NPDC001508 TaxID=3154656 RepID=UPI0033227B73
MGDLLPQEARDAADFIALMQQLKERSGLTYRELEEQAARNGDMLARSTLADVLRRTSLPRPDVLAAFVRACGDGQRADSWLEARERIAARPAASGSESESRQGWASDAVTGTATDASGAEPASGAVVQAGVDTSVLAARPRRTKKRTAVIAASVVVPVLALTCWVLLSDDSGSGSGSRYDSGAATNAWVTIRPARTPDLCLTEGRDRAGRYESAVAAQFPCDEALVPRTYLQPMGQGMYQIQWHHPQQGKGCLTVMRDGPVKGMLEPWDDCDRSTVFRLEDTDTADQAVQIRSNDNRRCVGIVDDDTAEGAEAVEEPCDGGADQRFLIRAS